jgi:alkanesulfonate monooxygenase SsuD/methylene tetrahydromethanopterin reductase-like flavin-dependent oxidoreductase (luciferase family)
MLGAREYGARLDDLVNHLRHTIPPDHAHYGAPVIPALETMPEIWVCGSSTAGPEAARIGARFCCTLFHGYIPPPIHLATYRATFCPSKDLATPHAAIAVAGVCADTEAEARAMQTSFPNPNYVPSVVGTPEQCKARIAALCVEYGVDEVIVLDIAPDLARRIKSVELLAQALELQP